MDRPSFQFYPADWRNNAKLRRCSDAARGAWMDVICVLHDADEYGVVRWPLADLARAAGVSLKLLKELASKDVLKGCDKNTAPYVYTPRHAGKDGETVTLIEATSGPCWYSSRMVKDEYVRRRRGVGSQFTSENQPPKHAPKDAPKGQPMLPLGERHGDGASSSSSSSKDQEQEMPPTAAHSGPTADPIFGHGLELLKSKGVAEKPARSFLGKLRRDIGDLSCIELLEQVRQLDITEPLAWLTKAATTRSRSINATEATSARAIFAGKTYSGSSKETIDAVLR